MLQSTSSARIKPVSQVFVLSRISGGGAGLGQVIAAEGDFDGIGGDEIRMADFEQVDDLLVEVVIVVPHPLPVTEDADVELEGGGEAMGQGISLELGRIDEKIPIGDFPGGADVLVDL